MTDTTTAPGEATPEERRKTLRVPMESYDKADLHALLQFIRKQASSR